MNIKIRRTLRLMLFTLSVCLTISNTQASVPDRIKQQINAIQNEQLKIGQDDIAVIELISQLYQYNEYHLSWAEESKINLLLNAIESSFLLGLMPEDYHIKEIKIRKKNGIPKSVEEQIQLDILLTDALLRLIYHLNYGKVIPGTLDPDWNFKRQFLTSDPVATLHYILRSTDNLKRYFDKLLGTGPVYQGLIQSLKEYREIKANGGWPQIPSGKVIKAGDNDPRIPLIKKRLQASGDLKVQDIDSSKHNYSQLVETGVKHFQRRHNLETDGVIGKGTLGQMNVTIEQRIDQIRANLERLRWVRHNLGDEFVLVNIAGYKLYYVRDNNIIWRSRVQVGKDYRKTPVFRDDIKYIVFNPTWTVPPTILSKDILPRLKKDQGYLKKKNMSVVDLKGNIIKPSTINWDSVTAKNFPYMIRQEPGPKNALGQVKIMFPNKHMVYLHDTPSKHKFSRAERAFSSGCIRVENPFELVEILLNDGSQWDQSRIQATLDTGKLQNVNLPQTIPVLLLYFTAQRDENGQVIFHRDIYKRDDKVIAGLAKPFHLKMPEKKAKVQ